MNTQVNNVDYVMIGAELSATEANIYTMNDLGVGDIRLFTPGGKPLGTNLAGGASADPAAGAKFIVAVGGTGGKPYFVSDVIDGSKIIKVSAVGYGAATDDAEQLDYIGSNGTAGSIQAVDDTLYYATVYIEDYLRSSHDGRYNKHFAYETGTGATQSEIALGLAKNGTENFSKEVQFNSLPPISFKAVCDDAGAIIPTGTGTVAVNKGSTIITFLTDVADATGATLLLVNEFLRFGTGVTSPVYKIMSIDTAADTITLDRPYAEVSNSAVANNTIERITVALGAAANWGVALTGNPLEFVAGKNSHKKMRWTLSLKDFGTTTITGINTTRAYEGAGGEVNQVAQHEYFCNGFKGEIYRTGGPEIHSFTSKVNASVAGSGYDVTRITYTSDDVVGFHNEVSPKTLTIYTPATAPDYMTETMANGGVWLCLETIAGVSKCFGVAQATGVVTTNTATCLSSATT